jgi:hypothetical protein
MCSVSSTTISPALQHQSMSFISVWFWRCPPGVSFSSCKLKAQFHKTTLASDANHKSWNVTRTSDSPPPDSGSIKPSKVLYLPLPVYYKRYNSGIVKRKGCIRQGMGGRVQSIHVFSMLPSKNLNIVMQTLSLRVVLEVSLCRHDWWNHWPSVISSVHPSPTLRSDSWCESPTALIMP